MRAFQFGRHRPAPKRVTVTTIASLTILLMVLLVLAGRLGSTSAHNGLQIQPSSSSIDRSDCVCPSIAACADAEIEQRCIEYLGNYNNVVSVRPMPSTLRAGRTAKLRAVYKDPCVEGIIKMPQSLFPLEPYAEYVAFETDRFLQFGNIPPTTFIFVPVADIEAAVSDFNNTADDKPISPGEPRHPRHEYARWIGTEVLSFALRRRLITPHPDSGKMVLGCSVQLLLRSVRRLSRTVLAQDPTYFLFLRSGELLSLVYAAKDASLGTDFSLRMASATLGRSRQLIESYRSMQNRALAGNNSALLSQSLISVSEHKALLLREAQHLFDLTEAVARMRDDHKDFLSDAVKFMSDTAVFDAIIGNDDRSPDKNSNAYILDPLLVPGSCAPGVASPTIRGLWIDQGKSFYFEHIHDRSLQLPLSPYDSQCAFRRKTLVMIEGATNGVLLDRYRTIVPPQIYAAIGEQHLRWASQRTDVILEHIKQCVAALGSREKVLVWD